MRESLQSLMKQAAIALAADAPVTPAQEAARKMSLAEFLRASWPIIEPQRPLQWGDHLQVVCDHVEALLTGRLGRRNLLVLVPPGSAKSTIVSVAAPAWMWVNHPTWRGLFASGNETVSTRDSIRCRNVLDSSWYRRTFAPGWSFSSDQNAKTAYSNTVKGSRVATTAASRVTGERGDGIFVDDALDATLAYSKSSRDAVIVWWRDAFANRLNDPQRGTRCVIAQRVTVEDLPGWIIANDVSAWDVLTIPQEWEEARRTTTSLGWTDPRKNDGELMFPERFTAEFVASEKARMGASVYASQHLQRPTIQGGEIFKRVHLQLLSGDALPKCERVVVSVDSAFKAKEENDYSAVVVLGVFARGVILLDVLRGRFPYPQLKQFVIEIAATWHPSALLIEDKASGQSLIQDLQQTTSLPVVPVAVEADKLTRAHTCVPAWEAHRVFAPANAPWLSDFLDELCSFPKAPHDDQVDALTQAVKYVNFAPGSGLIDYYRGQLAAETNAKTAPPPRTAWSTPALTERAKREGGQATDLTPWHQP